VYLIDTDAISEMRKQDKANPGVAGFFRRAASDNACLYLSAVTFGELRRGVEIIRHRGDNDQAVRLEAWLDTILIEYSDHILPFSTDAALLWGYLRVPHPENALDKQIAATALVHDLTVVTRNLKHFANTGVRLLNLFSVLT